MSLTTVAGPWSVYADDGGIEVRSFHPTVVAMVVGTDDIALNTAHLIAAAPALYAACETAKAVISAEPFWATDPDLAATFDLLTSALAQARGDLVDPLEQVRL